MHSSSDRPLVVLASIVGLTINVTKNVYENIKENDFITFDISLGDLVLILKDPDSFYQISELLFVQHKKYRGKFFCSVLIYDSGALWLSDLLIYEEPSDMLGKEIYKKSSNLN